MPWKLDCNAPVQRYQKNNSCIEQNFTTFSYAKIEKLKNSRNGRHFSDIFTLHSIFKINCYFPRLKLEEQSSIQIFSYQISKKYIKNIWKIGGKTNWHYSPLLVSLIFGKIPILWGASHNTRILLICSVIKEVLEFSPQKTKAVFSFLSTWGASAFTSWCFWLFWSVGKCLLGMGLGIFQGYTYYLPWESQSRLLASKWTCNLLIK